MMKFKYLVAFAVLAASGCGTDMPIKKIGGTSSEYIVNRDDKTPLGNLPDLKKRVLSEAQAHCSAQGKVFSERYSIDKERAIFVWPETTLYFECAEIKK